MRRFRDLEDFQDALDHEGIIDDSLEGLDEEDIEIMSGKNCTYTTKPKPKTVKTIPMKPAKKGK